MNINDMERMISLTDEKYIAEMFSDNAKVKRSRPALKITVCAAIMAAAVIGIFVAVNISESGNVPEIISVPKITVTEQIADPITENTAVTSGRQEVSESTEDTEEDAGKYFPNKDEIHISVAADPESYRSYDLPNEYVEQILPFGISDNDTVSGTVKCDIESDRSVGQFTVSDKKSSITFWVDSSGKCYSHYRLENYSSAERYGITVYGFDIAENIEENIPHALIAFWVSDGVGYSILFQNYDTVDALKVIDALILSGSPLDDVDLEQAGSIFENKKISLLEANNVNYFAGHVPQAVAIESEYGTLNLINDCVINLYRKYDKNGVLTEQNMDLGYFCAENIDGSIVSLNIFYDIDRSSAEIEYNTVVSPEDISLEFIKNNAVENESGLETHDFVIDYGDFIIGINGECGSETLWEFLKEIL